MNGPFYFFNKYRSRLIFLHIDCFLPSLVLRDIERYLVVFTNFVYQPADMYKNVLLTFIIYNETKTFSFIEKFYFTC